LWEAVVPCQNSDYGTIDIHRMKGRVIRDDGKHFLIQGVREVFEIFEAPGNDATATGKLVLIGRGLKKAELEDSIQWSVVSGAGSAFN
jgi:hypothetical protein